MKQVLSVAILLLLGIHGLQYGQPLLVVAFPRRPQQTNSTRGDLSQPGSDSTLQSPKHFQQAHEYVHVRVYLRASSSWSINLSRAAMCSSNCCTVSVFS